MRQLMVYDVYTGRQRNAAATNSDFGHSDRMVMKNLLTVLILLLLWFLGVITTEFFRC